MRLGLALVGVVIALTVALASRTKTSSGAAVPARDRTLDVAYELRGVALGSRVMLLEDQTGALTIADVRSPRYGSTFRESEQEVPNEGFTRSAFWLRVTVKNSSLHARAWMLELGFPHLDHVKLYVPRGEAGYEVRETGDMLPFAQRDLSYRNFVFALQEPALAESTYYLRIASSGSLSMPLTAWTLAEFVEHQYLDWAALCVFYGVILVMTCYNVALFAFTRDDDYLSFALFALSVGFFQLTIVGHTFQFLLPNHNAYAQTAVPFSIALGMYSSTCFGRAQLRSFTSSLRARRVLQVLAHVNLGMIAVAVCAPFRFSIRFVPVCCALLCCVSLALTVGEVRRIGSAARLFGFGWASLFAGALIKTLQTVAVLPTNFFTDWSLQLGATMQFVSVSAAMATKLTGLRMELRAANELLSQQVRALEDAVRRAEQATARAERATRVKDEFMATMSHELRTPLNTIINVPQGLVEEFPVQEYLRCTQCSSCFELELGESVDRATRCPDCLRPGTLMRREHAIYTGDATRTARYLETIERSGRHLLQVVNGILRSERNEPTEELDLSYALLDAERLARDVVEELAGLAQRSGVELTLQTEPGNTWLALDPLRIRQVLIDLIGNALKFSSGRGKVTVRVVPKDAGCLFSVTDEGIGIASDKLETVFESYQQAHGQQERHYGGTGLGLAISRTLVQKHGGTLWVESELGRGATFFFRIPRAQAAQDST